MDAAGSAPQPPTEGRAQRLALAALIGGALVIGASPLLVRASELGPIGTAFWRVALALPLLWIWRYSERRRSAARLALPRGAAAPGAAVTDARIPLPHAMAAGDRAETVIGTGAVWPDRRGLALAGLYFAADLAIWHTSLGLTSVANSTFLVNMAPLGVVIAAWVLYRERPRAAFMAGLAVALLGAASLMRASFGHSPRELAGDAVALGAAGALAAYMMVVRRLRARHSTAQIMLVSSLACAAALAPMTLAAGEPALPSSVAGWAVLATLALACHAGGQGLIAYSLARLPAGFSSLALLLEPVTAAGLAWALLGEAMDRAQLAGGAAVLVGIAIARRGAGASP